MKFIKKNLKKIIGVLAVVLILTMAFWYGGNAPGSRGFSGFGKQHTESRNSTELAETETGQVIDALVDQDFIPVIAPIGVSEEYEDYNINADDAACAVATALKAEKLVFLTDIEGVFIDPTDKSTLISEMDIHEAKDIIEKGVVGGGMLPKLNNCITAMENGVSRVHILDGRLKHCLLLEFFTQKGIGTAILKEPLF